MPTRSERIGRGSRTATPAARHVARYCLWARRVVEGWEDPRREAAAALRGRWADDPASLAVLEESIRPDDPPAVEVEGMSWTASIRRGGPSRPVLTSRSSRRPSRSAMTPTRPHAWRGGSPDCVTASLRSPSAGAEPCAVVSGSIPSWARCSNAIRCGRRLDAIPALPKTGCPDHRRAEGLSYITMNQ